MNLYQLKYIETPRLLIRPVELGDEFPLYESIERSLPALERWMPWARGTSFNATQDFIHRGYKHWQERTSKDFPLLVIHKESKKVISVSGYNEHTDLKKPCVEIGYWIDTTFEKQGLATELVNALTRYALQGLGAIRSQICTQVENTKSSAVAKRCGYIFEAKLRNICLDCSSHLPADGLLFSCCDVSMLPPLEVSWEEWPKESEKKEVPHQDDAISHRLEHAQPLPILQTKRLCLRAPRIQDNEKLYTALTASLNEAGPWFHWINAHLMRCHLQPHIDQGVQAAQDILATEYLFFLVLDRDQKNILGEIWIKVVDWAVPNLQIAFWFDFHNIGNHDVCEAIFTVARFAFAKRNAKCIQLYISEKNLRCLKLVRRLGFQYEGKLKNYFRDYITNEILSAETFSMTDFFQLKREQ